MWHCLLYEHVKKIKKKAIDTSLYACPIRWNPKYNDDNIHTHGAKGAQKITKAITLYTHKVCLRASDKAKK